MRVFEIALVYQINGIARVLSFNFTFLHDCEGLFFIGLRRQFGLYDVQLYFALVIHESRLLVETLGETFEGGVFREVSLVRFLDQFRIDFALLNALFTVLEDFLLLLFGEFLA
uniref:Pheromone binding protein 2 n=1 Tax=Cyrtotrachelus buqueti TaxID=1892066 RepID=A0A1L3KPR5_9CUCU|nr:pheromone binding protein 2 [Cyrtotrachelus buqueti]